MRRTTAPPLRAAVLACVVFASCAAAPAPTTGPETAESSEVRGILRFGQVPGHDFPLSLETTLGVVKISMNERPGTFEKGENPYFDPMNPRGLNPDFLSLANRPLDFLLRRKAETDAYFVRRVRDGDTTVWEHTDEFVHVTPDYVYEVELRAAALPGRDARVEVWIRCTASPDGAFPARLQACAAGGLFLLHGAGGDDIRPAPWPASPSVAALRRGETLKLAAFSLASAFGPQRPGTVEIQYLGNEAPAADSAPLVRILPSKVLSVTLD